MNKKNLIRKLVNTIIKEMSLDEFTNKISTVYQVVTKEN